MGKPNRTQAETVRDAAAALNTNGNHAGPAVEWLTGEFGTSVGAAGGASALPATPTGYLSILVNGAVKKIPYYN
jgi:hypothetical protein